MLGMKQNSGKTAPISSHPLFPAVVAIWFAALLGLGSLVLPVALFEKAVSLTGISSLISAAEPPLGTTARIAIAVFSGIAGAVAGLLIARKVTAAQAEKAPGRNIFDALRSAGDEAPGVKPILAHEELGSDSFDEPVTNGDDRENASGPFRGKRRALAVTDDSGPSDYIEAAPLPGGDAMIDQVDESETFDSEAEAELAEDTATEPLDLAEIAESSDASEFDGDGRSINAPRTDPTAEAAASEVSASTQPKAPEILLARAECPHSAIDPVAELRQELGTMTQDANSPEPAPYNPLGEQQVPQQPNNRPFGSPTTHVAQPYEETVGEFAQPVAVTPPPASVAIRPELDAAPLSQSQTEPMAEPQAVTDKALGDLGMVELVERFAMALRGKAEADAQARQAASASQEPSEPLVFDRSSAPPLAAPFTPSAAEEAGNAVAEFFASPVPETPPVMPPAVPHAIGQSETHDPAPVADAQRLTDAPTQQPASAPRVPASMQPVAFDELDDEDEEETPTLSLSINTPHRPFQETVEAPVAKVGAAIPAPAAAVGSEADTEAEEEVSENGAYSSLLAMKSPFASGQEFVRVEDSDYDTEDAPVEPAVVFPGSDRKAAPAIDGPSRDPMMGANAPAEPAGESAAARPFDAPGQHPAHGPATASENPNPGETERALREALEKLQRMSGAA